MAVSPQRKRGTKVGKVKQGKGTKIMAVADCHGLPVGLCIESASPHEIKLVDSTLVEMVIAEAPQNLVGDNAYDSDKLDAELRQYGIELVAPTGAIVRTRPKTGAVCAGTDDENRTAIRLAAKLSPTCHSVRAASQQFLAWHAAS